MQAHVNASRTLICVKLAVAAAAALAVLGARSSSSDWKPMGLNPDPFCINDLGHHWTQTMNTIVQQYESLGKVLILVSSLLLDTITLSSFFYYITTCNTSRLIYCVTVFYGIRALLQVPAAHPGQLPVQDPAGVHLADALHPLDDGALRHHVRLLLQRPLRLHHPAAPGGGLHRAVQDQGFVDRCGPGLRVLHPSHFPGALHHR